MEIMRTDKMCYIQKHKSLCLPLVLAVSMILTTIIGQKLDTQGHILRFANLMYGTCLSIFLRILFDMFRK